MSGYFQPEPWLTLDKAATLALIAGGEWPAGSDNHMNKWQIKSMWLCDELNAQEKNGYVYNAEAQRKIEAQEGIGPFNENGSILSILIYNAQSYRRSDKLIAQGYAPLSVKLIEEAIRAKQKIEVVGENIIGGTAKTVCRPVIRAGKAFALLARARNRGFLPDGRPARLVPA